MKPLPFVLKIYGNTCTHTEIFADFYHEGMNITRRKVWLILVIKRARRMIFVRALASARLFSRGQRIRSLWRATRASQKVIAQTYAQGELCLALTECSLPVILYEPVGLILYYIQLQLRSKRLPKCTL